MATDYSVFTDLFEVTVAEAVLREYPEPDALALVSLKKGQRLRRLDTVYWNGAWIRFYADVAGGKKYEGYLYSTDVTDIEDEPAPPQQQPPQQPQQQAPPQQPPPQHQPPQHPQQQAPPPQPPPQQPASPPPQQPAPQPPAGGPIIALGCVDANITDQQCAAYVGVVERTTNLAYAEIQDGLDKVKPTRLPPPPQGVMSIAEVQRALKLLGFFPGGEVDGICGYRTQSAIRLFQEYVRTMDRQDCVPDGRFGRQTQEHLQRWMNSGRPPNWAGKQGEYEAWLALLDAAKQKYVAAPGPILEKVNAFTAPTATRKVADWDFSGPGNIHLIGVRRNQATNKFDDIFVLLAKGLVFKFQGSTEPGASDNPKGPPHLVPGQHDYRFGWHQRKYLALRPKGAGVLVVRAGPDKKLDEADLAQGLEANTTINIHWGGRGMGRNVNHWSEGCQVINGEIYVNPAHQLVRCDKFAATTPDEPRQNASKTRGAYNVLVDVVTALCSDIRDNTVKYTLLVEADLDLSPPLKQLLEDSRAAVMKMV
jgi:hypothetical protein